MRNFLDGEKPNPPIYQNDLEERVMENALNLISADPKFACKLLIKITGKCDLTIKDHPITTKSPRDIVSKFFMIN